MDNQLVIKIILIVVFAVLALFLLVPTRGSRHVAIRRLTMLALFAVAVVAIVFPGATTAVAHAMGVGRGADLLLYGLIIVFVGNSIIVQRRHRQLEDQITTLARRIALIEAPAHGRRPPASEASEER
jgi:hypothetical protein